MNHGEFPDDFWQSFLSFLFLADTDCDRNSHDVIVKLHLTH
jgi:hypothetical protein